MKKIISAVKAIASGFNDLINFIQTCFKLIGDFLSQLVNFFKYLLQAFNMAFGLISSLPSWLQIFATATLTILLLYKILGRQAGGDN